MRLLDKEMTLPGTDLEVDVEFYYYEGRKGCTHPDISFPPEPAEVEITQIVVNKCCIIPALSKETLDAIETKLLEMDYDDEF